MITHLLVQVLTYDFDPTDKFTATLHTQRAKLAAKVLALPRTHHAHTTTFTDTVTFRQLHSLGNRRGRPKIKWNTVAYTNLWDTTHRQVTTNLYHNCIQALQPGDPRPPPHPTTASSPTHDLFPEPFGVKGLWAAGCSSARGSRLQE